MYASAVDIRLAAGLLNKIVNETPQGLTDASNRAYVAKRRPFVDSDADDEVTTDDVTAYVNGEAVDVASIDAALGKVTLDTAPGVGTKVTINYAFSPADDDYVAGKQEEAEDWINTKVRAWVSVPFRQNVPGIISTVAELYAAGLMLTRDYGNRADTQLTSKDGRDKIKLARELLDDYIQGLKDDAKANNTNGNTGTVSSVGDGDVFGRLPERLGGVIDIETDDEFFNRRQ